MATHYVYRFYGVLKDYSPKIWRRFEINGSKTIAELGYTLMTLFEMQASHLFCVEYNPAESFNCEYSNEEAQRIIGKEIFAKISKPWRFELPFEDSYDDDSVNLFDASESTIKRLSNEAPLYLLFNYDYGDNWEIELSLEHCEKLEIHASELPRVLAGEGFGIIEDCGGVGGLEELANAFKKKKGAAYSDYCDWLGTTELDLLHFNIDDINFRLKKLPRIYKEIYEYGYAPTKRSIALIERDYLE